MVAGFQVSISGRFWVSTEATSSVTKISADRVSYRTLRPMVVLRCTRRLLSRLKQADNLSGDASTTRLGDWYGNLLQLGHRQHLLFVSERSRLPVVIPIRQARHLATVFPDTVCAILTDLGVPAVDIAEER